MDTPDHTPPRATPYPADAGPDGEAPRWRLVGPGLVVAATGVGAADLVATLIAGSRYGYTLLWCAVLVRPLRPVREGHLHDGRADVRLDGHRSRRRGTEPPRPAARPGAADPRRER